MKPFVHPLARIHVPWLLTMHDRSTLGERATVYSLGEFELKSRSTVAQEVYLCAATHQFDDANLPLQVGKITIGEDAFSPVPGHFHHAGRRCWRWRRNWCLLGRDDVCPQAGQSPRAIPAGQLSRE